MNIFSIKWRDRFFNDAKTRAGWTKDPSTGVGCVIVDSDGIEVSRGWNGFPRGASDSALRLNDREVKLAWTVHAELNAICNAARKGYATNGTVAFVHGLPCCSVCAKHLVQAGVTQVYCRVPVPLKNSDFWMTDWKLSKEIFDDCDVGHYIDFVRPNGETISRIVAEYEKLI